jgi:hypothetical protein
VNWEEYCNQYLIALETAKLKLPEQERNHWNDWGWSFWVAEFFTFEYLRNSWKMKPEIIPDFSRLSNEDLRWFTNALENEQCKWFSLFLIAEAKSLPDVLLPALVRAAIYETNPSLNEHFLAVACRFGHCRVAEGLFEYAQYGTEFEKEAALYAFYWLTVFVDSTTEEGRELLALFDTVAANPQYSDTVRDFARRCYVRMTMGGSSEISGWKE